MHQKDVRDLLRAEHEEALALVATMCAAESANKRRELLKQLKPALTSHSRAEEAVVYRALLDVAGSTRAGVLGNAGFIEHGLAEVLLDMLARGRKPVSEEWTARAAALQGLLEHHIAEEHAVMFDELGTHFRPDELEAMGARFLREKRKHAGTRIEETA